MSNLWQIHQKAFRNDRESIMRDGNKYQIANGYMGYRGTLDEFGPRELVGITLAGVYDRVGDAWREPVNAPNGGFTRVTLDGHEISALSTPLKTHFQTLSLANAVFTRETRYRWGGKVLKITSTRFLSADQPQLGVISFSLAVDKAAKVTIATGIDYNIWDLNGPHLEGFTMGRKGDVIHVCAVTHEAGNGVVVAEAVDLSFGKQSYEISGKRHLRLISFNAEAARMYTFHKYFSVFVASGPAKNVALQNAIKAVKSAKASGHAQCRHDHDVQWKRRWRSCDVAIDGDDDAQLALRYSIFQLLIAAPLRGSENSIPARALSGQVYKGAIFWDTEMFMLPFFLYTYPEKAAELMRYRIKTLNGARRKAKAEGPGFRGAFYAWESQETGDDACTYFNIGDPLTKRDLRTYFRDKQIHISGDVAVALWEYFRFSGDDSLLLNGGAEVILECARFYYSYAYFKKDKHRYEILDVTGPDEYHERVNNNAFTNQVIKATFDTANAAVRYLSRTHPEALRALVEKINIADELPCFVEAAGLLYIPRPDEATNVIEQFDTYHRLNDLGIEELKARMAHPDEYLGAGQGLAVPTKIIKQADVIMMLSLFRGRYSTEVKTANWDYYEPRTEHGSSLSACAYAMVATDIGRLDRAYDYFLKTARIDLDAKYKTQVGTIFMGGSHPAANGGAWMATVLGFGGVSAEDDQVTINPQLYLKWAGLRFNLIYKGDKFSIKITHSSVIIVANRANRDHRRFIVCGNMVTSAPGRKTVVKYG